MPDIALPITVNEALADLTRNQMVASYLERHPGFDQDGPVPSHYRLQGAMLDMVTSAHLASNLNAWPDGRLTHMDDIVSAIGWLSAQSPAQFKGESAKLFSDAFINNPECREFARELEFALAVLEKQSPETWTHIQNHTALTMLYFERQCEAEDRVLGLQAGTTFQNKNEEALLLLLGALGHDIGKVGIHPGLLHKSSRIDSGHLETAMEQYSQSIPDYPEKAHDIAFLHSANEGRIIFAHERDKEKFPDAEMILDIGSGYARGEFALTDEQQRQRHSAIWERINQKAQQSSLAGWLSPEEQKTLTMPKRGTVSDHEMAVIATHDGMSEEFFKAASPPERLKPLSRIVSMDRFRQERSASPDIAEGEMKLSNIIHTTDVLEALMASRSYRSEPLPADQAITIMKEQADKGLISKNVITHLERNGTLEIYQPHTPAVTQHFAGLTAKEPYYVANSARVR